MARRISKQVSLDFAFYERLWDFYRENRGRIRQQYSGLTKKYLDFNDPSNAGAFLRQPQFEALEMYVFLKEYLNNAPVYDLFLAWQNKSGAFAGRTGTAFSQSGQLSIFGELTKEQFEDVYAQMRAYPRIYPNYIYGLTMGTGKTILMATCIFYEFLLANKFPKDPKYCHNALVFAPDRTVLQSLREIQTFDKSLVVPPAYVNWVNSNIRFHFLEEAGTTLDTLDRSRFNLIISNTQKIILKRERKEKTPLELLMGSGKPTYQPGSVYDEFSDLYGLDEPEDNESLVTNQRFEKLRRLEQLGIYIDEAHHAFGTNLARDVGAVEDKRETSLRLTVDALAAELKKAGTRVVACYNYTGTPYAQNKILPEVVYAYSLQEAIDKQFLKKVRINGYSNPRSIEFVNLAVDDFLKNNSLNDRHEGLRPKMAFFAATIEELQQELRPALENALAKHNVPTSRILVNVGDSRLTSDDDIREFNRLDTPSSDKQFILLVGKGKEGWNCRSLFGVALFRKPNSKIFVLQATMRCLRSISDAQQTGRIYLSEENRNILNDELQQNFRVDIDTIQQPGSNRVRKQIRVKHPVESIKLRRVRRLFNLREKQLSPGVSVDLDKADTDHYRLIRTEQDGLMSDGRNVKKEDITNQRERRRFSEITLVAEVARYLNRSPLEIRELLAVTQEGVEKLLSAVNEFNELLYDWIIPRLFHILYNIEQFEKTEEYEVELVKVPEKGYYEISGRKELIIEEEQVEKSLAIKSFHLDTYCFDSEPERQLFWKLIRDGRVKKLYFTGMLTHGQSDFFVQYIDPDSHTIRSYYPDFLFQKENGSYVIVEVKGEHMVDLPVVQAKKEFARQMAVASGMTYEMIGGRDVASELYAGLFS